MKRDKDARLVERARAAVCYANARQSPLVSAYAFLALFHPEIGQDKRMEMAKEMVGKQS